MGDEIAQDACQSFRIALRQPCANEACRNSHVAAQRLTAAGYRNVPVYAGGKQNWTEAGLKLEI